MRMWKNTTLVVFIYACFSALGLLLLKIGATRNVSIKLTENCISIKLDVFVLLGALFYTISFFISVIGLKSINLSLFYPLSAGMVFVLVCLASRVLLKESISIERWIGMLLILCGVILMNIRGQ